MTSVSRRAVLRMSVAGGMIAAAATEPSHGQTLPVSPPSGVPDIEAHRRLVQAVRSGSSEIAGLVEQLFPRLKTAPARWEPPEKRTGPTPGTATWGSALSDGCATVWDQDFLFVTASDRPVSITIDDQPSLPMQQVAGTQYWTHLDRLRLGTTHNYTFHAEGRNLGCSTVPGYNMGSYPIANAPRGELSAMHTVTSTLYGGARSDYWLYTNPGLDTENGAPLMIWFDGEEQVGDQDWRGIRLQTVSDNLVHQKRIPPMVHLLIQPGRGGTPQKEQFPGQGQDNRMRSLQYDTVSDLFARHIVGEVLPDVEKSVKLRQDGYSRGSAGKSSGGIASFKLSWFRPDAFSRSMPSDGSFVGLQWHPEQNLDGGFIFPFLVRREARRNLRVWISDGSNDIEVDAQGRPDLYAGGSWPLSNISMAQALKTKLYDFHFRFGEGYHNNAQQGLDLPEALSWLWREYDPAQTSQNFEQDPAEQRKPLYRVRIANREAW